MSAAALGMLLHGGVAMADDPGDGAGEGFVESLQSPGAVPVYEVPYFSSVNSSGKSSGTVIIVKNNDDEECDVDLDWYFGGTADVACELSSPVDPNTWVRLCSRDINGQHLTGLCDETCPGELTFTEGYARIFTQRSCRNRLAVHAMQYYSNGNAVGPAIEGTRTLNVVRLPAGRTKGD